MTCCDNKPPTFSTGMITGAACAPGAIHGGLSRTRFFDGIVLTQADLENEQRFWRVKRRLTNRALGTGVVWGLRLRWDPRRRLFALAPGYALDCCGNDLIVESAIETTEAELIARADPSLTSGTQYGTVVSKGSSTGFSMGTAAANRVSNSSVSSPRVRRASVVLQYVECAEEPRPTHNDACSPPSNRCEPSRIRETTRLLLVPPPLPMPPSCLQDAFADLAALKAQVAATSPDLVHIMFPPPLPSSTTFPAAGPLPLSLRITTPGATREFIAVPNTAVALPANGTLTGGVAGQSTPDGGQHTGVVRFELRAVDGWALTAGTAKDGSIVVDEIGSPTDTLMSWPLVISAAGGALGSAGRFVTVPFSYVVQGLALQELADARAAGTAKLTITGNVTVLALENGHVVVSADAITVTVESNVSTATTVAGCLDLAPSGLFLDPPHARDDFRLLELAVAYALFTEATALSGGAWTRDRVDAANEYADRWHQLGVEILAQGVTDQLRADLARILANLFQCWCDSLLYPGPRCESEHHGVYLGSATVSLTGQILTFDMWDGRRQVLTGPLFEHWLNVFGFAALDVIVGRLNALLCCVSTQPLPASPGNVIRTDGGNGNGGGVILRVDPGTARGAVPVGVSEMLARIAGAIVGDRAAPLARYTTTLANGAVVEVTAPSTRASAALRESGDLAGAASAAIDRADDKLSPLARVAARAAIAEVARDIATVPDLSTPAAALAKDLGLSLAGLVAAGPEGLFAATPSADPAAVDELLARARDAFAAVAENVVAAVKMAKVARPSALLKDPEVRKAAATGLGKRFDGFKRETLDAALDRCAASTP